MTSKLPEISVLTAQMGVLAVEEQTDSEQINNVVAAVRDLGLFDILKKGRVDQLRAQEKAALLAMANDKVKASSELQKMAQIAHCTSIAMPLLELTKHQHSDIILNCVASIDADKQAAVVAECVELLRPINEPKMLIKEAFEVVQSPSCRLCKELTALMQPGTLWENLLHIIHMLKKYSEDTHADLQQRLADTIQKYPGGLKFALTGLECDIDLNIIVLESDDSVHAEENLLMRRISQEPVFQDEVAKIQFTKRVEVLRNLLYIVPREASSEEKIAVLLALKELACRMSAPQVSLLLLEMEPLFTRIKDFRTLPPLLEECANMPNRERRTLIEKML